MTDLDTPAIGRKIARLMRDDRPGLVSILRATPRDQWSVLASAYIQAIGLTEATDRQANVPGVLFVWSQITKEQTS